MKRKLLLSVIAACILILIIGIYSFNPISDRSGMLPSGSEQLNVNSYVTIDVYRPIDGDMTLIYHDESHNVITNAGLHVIERRLGGAGTWQWTAAQGGTDKYYRVDAPTYIGLSSDGTGVNAVHSSWQAVDGSYPSDIEITTGGLGRASGTFTMDTAYTAGSGATRGSVTYTISRTFTVTAGSSFTNVQKAGLFTGAYNTNDGSTSALAIGTLVAENIFTPVDLNAGDQIAITWSVTI